MAGRFPLLVDEHVPRAFVQALQRRGWSVVRIVDLADLGQGAPDERVFEYALENGFVVLSSDERALWRPKRYREQGRPFPGMLCWPHRHRDRMTLSEAMDAIEEITAEPDPFVYGYRFIQPQPA